MALSTAMYAIYKAVSSTLVTIRMYYEYVKDMS